MHARRSTTAEPTAHAGGLRHLVAFARARGAAESELLARVDVSPSALTSPDSRLPVSAYYAGLEAGAALTGDPLFGLHYVQSVTHDSLGALGFLAMASATLGEAIERIIRFHRVLTEGERFEMAVEGDRVEFRVHSWGPERPAHGHIAEMYAYDCSVMAERLTGAPAPPLLVELHHRPRAPLSAYREIYGFSPRFEASVSRWVLPSEILGRRMPRTDAMLARFLEPQLTAALERLPAARSLATDLFRVIAERLPDGVPSLAEVARALRLAPRTLQRRLTAEGHSFASFVDGLRRAQSERWLGAGASIAEVSFLVGYSEPRAFHRAFKRWSGTTPEAWRDARQAAPPRRA